MYPPPSRFSKVSDWLLPSWFLWQLLPTFCILERFQFLSGWFSFLLVNLGTHFSVYLTCHLSKQRLSAFSVHGPVMWVSLTTQEPSQLTVRYNRRGNLILWLYPDSWLYPNFSSAGTTKVLVGTAWNELALEMGFIIIQNHKFNPLQVQGPVYSGSILEKCQSQCCLMGNIDKRFWLEGILLAKKIPKNYAFWR